MKTLSVILALFISLNVFADNSTAEVLDIRSTDIKTEKYWVLAKSPSPKYPKIVFKNDISGCVIFSLTISEKGMPIDIKLETTKPNSMFVREAKDAVKRYRWKPSQTNTDKQSIRKHQKIIFLTKKISTPPKCKIQ